MSTPVKPVNVALLGRNTIVREGLSRILTDEHFAVIKSSDDPSGRDLENGDICAGHEDEGAFLIVIDSDSEGPDINNVKDLRGRFPDARLVLLANKFDFNMMINAFRQGVHGYIVKQIRCEPLIGSLNLVAMGEKVFPTEFASSLPEERLSQDRETAAASLDAANLSCRETDILRCLIMGYPNKIVSRLLDISEATVKVHVKAILRKLQLQNRTQAAIWAVNNGIEGYSSPGHVIPPSVAQYVNAASAA